MNFELSEHHALLRSNLRQFFKGRVQPRAREWDEAERFPFRPAHIAESVAELVDWVH